LDESRYTVKNTFPSQSPMRLYIANLKRRPSDRPHTSGLSSMEVTLDLDQLCLSAAVRIEQDMTFCCS